MGTKTLSSGMTFFYKYVFSIVWISGFGAGTVALWSGVLNDQNGALPPAQMAGTFLAIWIVGSAFIWWSCARLKRVRLGDGALWVSNYRRKIRIPLDMIAGVTENRWINIHPVTIHLRAATEFGNEIVFMPTMRVFGMWRSHPVVAELTEAARLLPRG